MAGYARGVTTLVLALLAAPAPAAEVVEFYNNVLDTFFITADPNEAAAIDKGGAGPGWLRTGLGFGAGGTTSVCRFYGSISPGPNSHFYTALADECAALKQLQATTPATQKRWNFESLDFYTSVPAGGACPAGTVPVFRAYNNGFTRGVDSNHRITTSTAAIQQVVSRGWKDEAVVMCAPPANAYDKRRDAARFLRQATFGMPREAIDALVATGYDLWLERQFALPAVSHLQTFLADPGTAAGDYRLPNLRSGWKQKFEGDDQLRQRVADALLQIFVVSYYDNKLGFAQCGVASYLDVLNRGAFGNFRDLLKDVTLHPIMGDYLSMKGSAKSDPVLQTQPDENYGREVMQLFTVGLYLLNEDGSQQLGADGKPLPTFNEDTVKGFARALSGWSWPSVAQQVAPYLWRWNGDPYFADGDVFQQTCDAWSRPMSPWLASYSSVDGKRTLAGPAHDQDAKQLLVYAGAPYSTLPAGQSPQLDLENFLDNLFHHPNVGPFIGRQLIQRLVTSNPSPQYVARVARTFNDNGHGIRGDMQAVVRTILLDPEARSLAVASQPTFGKLAEPVVRFVQYFRTFKGKATGYNFGYSLDSPNLLNQQPLKAPSVFNFFSPDFVPGGPVARAGLVGPEFQITTTASVAGYANFSTGFVAQYKASAPGYPGDIIPDFSDYVGLADTPAQLLDELDMVLCGMCMDPGLKARFAAAIANVTTGNSFFGTTVAQERLLTALWLVINSPDYLVQK